MIQRRKENLAANEQWIPIISEVLSWIKAMHGPTKRELRIKVSELEQKVQLLTDGNVTLANNIELITSEILKVTPHKYKIYFSRQ